MFKKTYLYFLPLLFYSCVSNDETTLEPAEDRISNAKTALVNDLIAPTHGWVLNYQPVPEAGIYYILLDFKDDGTVTIESDVSSESKDFYIDEIPFRVDARLNLELILETYGVFHYLFEQQASTFEAEFEFLYVEKEGENLIFASKSDLATEQTILTFVPATADASNAFSREAQKNWSSYQASSPQFLGASPAQQVSIPSENISVYWNINFLERKLEVSVAAEGASQNEVNNANNFVIIDHITTYQIANDKLTLSDPFSFLINGKNYTVGEIELGNYNQSGEPVCHVSTEGSPLYEGVIPGIGTCIIYKTLYDYEGSFFVPNPDSPYSVNVLFVIDGNGFSLSQSGSINEHFPKAVGFAFNYGYLPNPEDPQEPPYAVGLYVEDSDGNIQSYLREFEMTTTNGNSIDINLLDNYYFSVTPKPNDQANLEAITNEIFAEGRLYASGVDTNGNTVFRLYNPCNQYEVYLVK